MIEDEKKIKTAIKIFLICGIIVITITAIILKTMGVELE